MKLADLADDDSSSADAENFEAIMPDIKILMNKYHPFRNASKDAWNELVNNYKDLVLPFQIKEAADLQNSINEGVSIFEVKSSREVKASIEMLAAYVCPLINIE